MIPTGWHKIHVFGHVFNHHTHTNYITSVYIFIANSSRNTHDWIMVTKQNTIDMLHAGGNYDKCRGGHLAGLRQGDII